MNWKSTRLVQTNFSATSKIIESELPLNAGAAKKIVELQICVPMFCNYNIVVPEHIKVVTEAKSEDENC